MSRIPRETDAALPVGFAQVLSEKGCLCVGQAWIVRLQSRRQRGPISVATKTHRRVQFIQPFLESPRRQFGAAVRQPERVQRDQAGDPSRPDTGIQTGDIAAQAVADQSDGLVG